MFSFHCASWINDICKSGGTQTLLSSNTTLHKQIHCSEFLRYSPIKSLWANHHILPQNTIFSHSQPSSGGKCQIFGASPILQPWSITAVGCANIWKVLKNIYFFSIFAITAFYQFIAGRYSCFVNKPIAVSNLLIQLIFIPCLFQSILQIQASVASRKYQVLTRQYLWQYSYMQFSCLRYSLLTSVISYSPRADGFRFWQFLSRYYHKIQSGQWHSLIWFFWFSSIEIIWFSSNSTTPYLSGPKHR